MVVLIACVTCAKAKAKCDKKIPCSRCTAKRIQCRPRGDRRFSDGQTELSRADIELIAAANEEVPGLQTPFHSRRPSIGKADLSRRQSRQNTPPLKSQPKTSFSNSTTVPWPTANSSSLAGKEQQNQLRDSAANLSCLRYNPSYEHDPMLTNIDPAAIRTMTSLFDPYMPLTLDPMQTDDDLPNLDMSIFPEFALPLGDYPFPATFNDLHIGNSAAAFDVSRTLSNDTLPSLSPGSSSDGSSIAYRRVVEEQDRCHEEEEESWPAFRCNPLQSAVSRSPTSGRYLDGLLNVLENHETWSSWTSGTSLLTSVSTGRVGIESFDDVSREKLTVVTQSFLSLAFDVHRGRSMDGLDVKRSHSSGSVALPPAKTLEYFLNAYIRHFETYNVCCPGNTLRPNWLLHQSDANLSILLILLMLAYGAAADATPEARYLSNGLIEVCKISWQKLLERDMGLTRNPTALLSGLLLTTLQAWSGDGTFMEVAMGQRDSFVNMLRQAGFLETQPQEAKDLRQHQTIDAAWEHWKLDENKSRLVYAWVTLDQEISLYYDTAPLVCISDLKTPLPSVPDLWQARSATEWWNRYERQQGSTMPSKASLSELFRKFVEEDVSHIAPMDAAELRLLLHPLQGLINHLRQFSRCFNEHKGQGKASGTKEGSVTLARQEEIKGLLGKWYQLSCKSTEPPLMIRANLINFHLISLNTLVDFAEVERAARADSQDNKTLLPTCIKLIDQEDIEKILMHCGQVGKNVQGIPIDFRPHWWGGAHYRVALTAWAVSIAGRQFGKNDQRYTQPGTFAIDTLAPEHPSMALFMKRQSRAPAFSGANGSLVSLSSPKRLLVTFCEYLEEDLSMPLTHGTRNKLRRLAERWESVTG